MLPFPDALHLAMDVGLCGVCGLALHQWRDWRLRALVAERQARDILSVTRHFHTQVQRSYDAATSRSSVLTRTQPDRSLS
jgi:hypothetical protein